MFSEDVLARLSQVNRNRPPVEDIRGDSAPCPSPALDLRFHPTAEEDVSQLPPGEEVSTAWGTHWVRRQPLSRLWPQSDRWLSRHLRPRESPAKHMPTRSRDLRLLLAHLPDQVVYLDLETCGFAGSMVFLVGLIHWHCDDLQLTQIMARNYAEEKSMLQALWSIVARHPILVTFNGKSFDWPMVHDRSTVHRLGRDLRSVTRKKPEAFPEANMSAAELLAHDDPRPEPLHCDLLHLARRRWKRKLPNCKLQTLERYICGRRRTNDIPGHEIPAAYHDFVRSGDAWLMRGVLHHNALDLVTLLQLSLLLLPSPAEQTPAMQTRAASR